jgi:hypothetical protein
MATVVGWSSSLEKQQKQQPTLNDSSLIQRFLAIKERSETRTALQSRITQLEDDVLKYVAECDANHVVKLESELEQTIVAGRNAELELRKAKDNEMLVRGEDAQRDNAYNATLLALKNAKDAPLGSFFSQADVDVKNDHIAKAQTAHDAALNDLKSHPYCIPQAVNSVREAEQRLGQLQAKARSLRHSIAQLKGEPVQPEATLTNNIGLR